MTRRIVKLMRYLVIGRNDGLWLSFNNRTKRTKRDYYATNDYEQNDDDCWSGCWVSRIKVGRDDV
jgi:hypothetical protein